MEVTTDTAGAADGITAQLKPFILKGAHHWRFLLSWSKSSCMQKPYNACLLSTLNIGWIWASENIFSSISYKVFASVI